MFDTEWDKAIEPFKNFMEQLNEDKCLENEVRISKHISDEYAKSLIKRLTRSDNPQILQHMDKKERDEIIRQLKKKNISIRQLSRITGIGRRIIEKAQLEDMLTKVTENRPLSTIHPEPLVIL